MGVVVDPVEDLPGGLLGERRHGLGQGRVEEVLAQRTLGPVGEADPDDLAEVVDDGATDDEEGEQLDETGARVLREAPDDHGAESEEDGGGGRAHECRPGCGGAHPTPVDGALECHRGGSRRWGGGRSLEGLGHGLSRLGPPTDTRL